MEGHLVEEKIHSQHYAVLAGGTQRARAEQRRPNLCGSRVNCAFQSTIGAPDGSLRLILWERQGRDCFPHLAGEENRGSERVNDEPKVTQIESDGAGT